jgi:homogentisate 1,2-dioxygenase
LYTEEISGSVFTAAKGNSQRSWLYRIRPSLCHTPFKKVDHSYLTNDFVEDSPDPNQVTFDIYIPVKINLII